jgi:hypothetical protein
MKTIELDHSAAHKFVDENAHRGYFWDGWTINRWVPNPSGFMSQSGAFRSGMWGMKYSFPLSSEGTWTVKAPTNVKHN